jgi:hypothetical protein
LKCNALHVVERWRLEKYIERTEGRLVNYGEEKGTKVARKRKMGRK